jgi:hypothetical protein
MYLHKATGFLLILRLSFGSLRVWKTMDTWPKQGKT